MLAGREQSLGPVGADVLRAEFTAQSKWVSDFLFYKDTGSQEETVAHVSVLGQ